MNKVFALVDCNAFYCACERLFRPDLLGIPVGVLSNNDGCFVSRTVELKKLGIPMGAPYFKYKDVCEKNKVAVFSSNFGLYTNMSDRVMITLSRFTPELEIYSVDEAFLNLGGFEKRGLHEYGTEIKKIVERDTGIPVSIGIGPTKVLAKAANAYAKKEDSGEGVVSVMNRWQQDRILAQLDIEEVWGIGRGIAQRFRKLHINTAKDFRDFNNEGLIQKKTSIVGRRIQEELRGNPCFELELEAQKKKEILSSRTFGDAVYDLESLREAVSNYASVACEKLRKQRSVCSTVEVWIRTNPFKKTPQYYAVDCKHYLSHTADTRKVIKYALSVLEQLYREGYEYKKALVKLSGIRDRSSSQLSFLEQGDTEKDLSLMKAMDRINQKEGPMTLRVASCGVYDKAWKMKQSHKSPRYLSGWSQIPPVA